MFERSEFAITPQIKVNFGITAILGAFFFGSVSFGQTKEMNAMWQQSTDLYIKICPYGSSLPWKYPLSLDSRLRENDEILGIKYINGTLSFMYNLFHY